MTWGRDASGGSRNGRTGRPGDGARGKVRGGARGGVRGRAPLLVVGDALLEIGRAHV
jgi:hypothetical protein